MGVGKLPGCLNACSQVWSGPEVTWGQPASRFLGPTWLSLHSDPVPHLSLTFPSISPGNRLGQQLSWGRFFPFTVLPGRRSRRGECGQQESGGQHPARRCILPQRCHGLNLHLRFWERAGKHFVSEFVASNPQRGEREALNDCTILSPVFHKGFFLISTLAVASPGVSLHSAGCSLCSCAGWRERACEEPACSQLGFGPEPQWDKGSAPRAPQHEPQGSFPQRVFALQAA